MVVGALRPGEQLPLARGDALPLAVWGLQQVHYQRPHGAATMDRTSVFGKAERAEEAAGQPSKAKHAPCFMLRAKLLNSPCTRTSIFALTDAQPAQ